MNNYEGTYFQYEKKDGMNYMRPFLVPSGQYSDITGYTPAMLRHYYSLTDSFPTGKGITIGIVTAYGSPTLAQDLQVFSETFSLNPPDITVRDLGNASGTQGIWVLESSSDSQWAHAFAPGARLICYFAPSADFEVIMEVIKTADPECDILSLSFGKPEFAGQIQYEPFFRNSHALCVCAAGDQSRVNYPAASAGVLCVGGTQLYLDQKGNAIGQESVWSETGCGISRYTDMPDYQKNFDILYARAGGKRALPDLALYASGEFGAAFYHSTPVEGFTGWTDAVGTSISTPCIAGICACLAEKNPEVLKARQSFFYRLAGEKSYTNPYRAYGDIVLGSSGGFSAAVGFDFCSGLGTPRASVMGNHTSLASQL